MTTPLPPGTTKATFANVPPRHREDAIQEAWLAHLEKRKPTTAIKDFLKREKLHEKRITPASQLNEAQLTEQDRERLD